MTTTETGALGLALVTIVTACSPPPNDGPVPPGVLFILVDTLRKDHLRLYGHERDTSPHIDQLGAEGWVFEGHIAPASHTVPSTVSMLTSCYPVEHGIVHRYYRQFVENPPLLPEELATLTEVLQERGYATAGFVANPHLGEKNGFDQGFDHFEFTPMGSGEEMTESAEDWLRDTVADREPFFAYLHYMDVHSPYRATPEHAARYAPDQGELLHVKFGPSEGVSEEDLAYTIAMYDACIRFVDDQVGRWVEVLEELGIRDNTVIVFTSDHGEEFLDHGGMGHGTTVFGELVRLPLVVSYRPKLEPGRRFPHLTRSIDVAPTLLEWIGIPIPDSFRGSELSQPAHDGFAEDGPWRSIHAEAKSLIVNLETGEERLFEASDELDQRPIEDELARKRLRQRLDQYLQLEEGGTSAGPRENAPAWSDEDLKLLKSLGYAE
jgi:arylsulfatase A-like enzyme